jgi:drug/metabolite transporter (DMT)-like permease
VAVVGVSFSAPVTAATAAPVLAVAFWRNLVGTGVSGAWAVSRDSTGLRTLPGRVAGEAVLSGCFLAVHFVTWFSGLRLTSVTAATALVCTTPIWTVGLDLARRRPVPRAVVLGVLVAMVGVLAITGVDAGRSGRALAGDLLSLTGAIAAGAYVAIGDRVMRSASTAVYTTLAYGTCAVLLLPACLLTGTALAGFSARTWVELAVVTIGAQILGHTLINAALPFVGVTPVALSLLLEVPGATLVAWAWYAQTPPIAVVPGTLLMLLGLVVVVRARPGPDLLGN